MCVCVMLIRQQSPLPMTLQQTVLICLYRVSLSLVLSSVSISSYLLLVWVIQSRFGSDEPPVLFMPGHSPLKTPYRTNHAHAVGPEGGGVFRGSTL